MTESYSVEAILSVYDNGFSNGFKQAQASMQQATQSSNAMGSGILKNSVAFGVASTLASKAMSVVTSSLDGAISRFDTLKKYPVVMNALGYSISDVSKSVKLLSNGIDGLPTSLDEITSSAQQLAPLVGSAQKAAKSALALNNAFLASGASAGDASRGLMQYTQMLSTGKVDMASWRTLTETMPIALRKVANSFGYTGKSAETDLYDALQNGEITIDQLNDKFIELNGGVNGFAILAKKNSAGIGTSFANLRSSVVKNLGNMITAINNGFSEAGFGSIAQQLDNLKYAINGTFAVITPIVTTATSTILTDLKSLFDFVKSNKDWLVPLTIGIVGGVASFKTLNKAIDTTKNVWDGAKAVFNTGEALIGIAKGSSSASSALTILAKDSKIAAAAQAALNAVAELNPYVLIATAIIAVGAALTYWVTQTESGKQAWQNFTQAILPLAQTAFDAIRTVVIPIISTIIDTVRNLWDIFKSTFSSLIPVLMQIFSALSLLVPALQAIWEAIKPILEIIGIIAASALVAIIINLISTIGVLGSIISLVAGIIIAAVTSIISIFNILLVIVTTSISVIVTVISTVVQMVIALFTGQWDEIPKIFNEGWNKVRDTTARMTNAINNIISSWGDSLVNAGRAMMDGFLSGLKSAWEGVKSFVSGIASWIKKHKGPISYDRKLLVPAGKAIMTGLNSGLNSTFGTVQDTVESIAGAITDAMDISSNISYNGLDSLATIGQRTFTGNYQGSMKLQDTNLQLQNNALLRQIANKESSIYLDGDTLVGGTIDRTNQQLGNRVQLQSRWN